jgi:hypothetical protein
MAFPSLTRRRLPPAITGGSFADRGEIAKWLTEERAEPDLPLINLMAGLVADSWADHPPTLNLLRVNLPGRSMRLIPNSG